MPPISTCGTSVSGKDQKSDRNIRALKQLIGAFWINKQYNLNIYLNYFLETTLHRHRRVGSYWWVKILHFHVSYFAYKKILCMFAAQYCRISFLVSLLLLFFIFSCSFLFSLILYFFPSLSTTPTCPKIEHRELKYTCLLCLTYKRCIWGHR